MAQTTTNLEELKINFLSEDQYKEALAAGTIQENEVYMTPDNEIGIANATTPGIIKSGTDISVDAEGNVSVNDNSHLHTIENVTGLQSELDNKVEKVNGKGLSTNDYTTAEKDKLSGIEAKAEVNQNAFSYVTIGTTTVEADQKTDTLTLAGSNVTLTPDTVNDKITIGITKDNVTDALGYTPINSSLKGANNGLAELDSTGKVPSSQLPSFVDDVIEGYLNGGKFYEESSYVTAITGESGKIYIDLSTEKTYRWSGSSFVVISETLALGETASTAYRGDRGKIAYDHSQSAHARTDATNVQASSVNGNVLIDGAETVVYTHPSGTNPHGTTKSDVGLGNVPNVTTNDQTPTYTESSTLTKLVSGEKLSVAFGKISKAITDLISHISDSVIHITSTERTNWNDANDKKHTHENKSILDAITQTLIDNWNSAYSHISDSIKHITSTERTNWDSAYNHSTSAHAPSDAEANQNAFSNVTVGTTNIAADSKTDTLTLAAGDNVTLTPDATNDKVTISAKDTTYSAGTGLSLSGTTFNHSNSVTAGTAQGDSSKTLSFGGTFKVPSVSYDAQGHVTSSSTTTMTMPANPNTHYESKNVVGSSTATSNTSSALANGNVYLNSVENGAVTSSHKISGSGATSVTTDSSGNIIISSTDNDTVTTVSTTGSGNAITSISASNGAITATKGSTFLTEHPSITTSADSTSTASPAHGGTFTAVDSVARDSNGHVTKVNTKTITLPADNDTKVTQTLTSSDASYPLLLAPSGQSATATTTSYFDSGVTLNPSTNTIAANISGTAANADTSTKLGSSTVGSSTKPIYLNAGTATESSSTVGGATKPMYLNSGTMTACDNTLDVSITGNASSANVAIKATQDANGNQIDKTYEPLINIYTVTFSAADWTGDADTGYTQTVACAGILASEDLELFACKDSDTLTTLDDIKAYNTAYGILSSGIGTTDNDSVTWQTLKQITTDITVVLKG